MNNNILKKISQNNIVIIKLIFLLIISGFLAITAATLFDSSFINTFKLYLATKNIKNEQYFRKQDFNLIDYKIYNNIFETTSNDPMLILNRNINEKVSTVTINFNKPLENDLDIQVYYTNNSVDFNADQVATEQVKAGEIYTKVRINQYVEKLRIDIGTTAHLDFALKDILINDNKDKVSFTDLFKNLFVNFKMNAFHGIWNDRFRIMFIVFIFLGLHFIINIKKMYLFIFKKRWLLGGLLLLFLVINKYHGDSMSLYDTIIQPGQGSEYMHPVLGVPRSIRSDEWVVSTPFELSSHFGMNAFSKYNKIVRATDTLNSTSGIHATYSTLGKNPFLFAYLFMGLEYAFSFVWYAPIIVTFLLAIELFLIISQGKRLLSVTGAFLVVFSSYYLWWDFPFLLTAAQGAIVCAYYFIKSDQKWKKLLFGLGTAISASIFITNLYPAWQVPLGYICLALLIWLIHDNWKDIKALDKIDWCIFCFSFLILITLVGSYFYGITEYINSIAGTVYPGKRLCNGGSDIGKIFYYFQSVLYPYKSTPNPSEEGVFLSFFPVPMVCATYLWFKNKKKDWLNGSLIIVSLFLLIYTVFGFPDFLAKITLMSSTLPKREIDFLGYIQVLFIIIIFSRYDLKIRLNKVLAIAIGILTAVASMMICRNHNPGYIPLTYSVLAIVYITFICYGMLAEVPEKIINIILGSLIVISIINGICVRPVVKGLDAVYSKPVSKEISSIMQENKNAKWLVYGGGPAAPGFAVANGAPTINSVQIYPNLRLWHDLDADKKYENVYNRYAHVNLQFNTEKTSMELIQPDYFTLNLNVNDLSKTGADYILSLNQIDLSIFKNNNVKLIYNEFGCYIYKIND